LVLDLACVVIPKRAIGSFDLAVFNFRDASRLALFVYERISNLRSSIPVVWILPLTLPAG
jgi:hypothetical protein